MRKPKSVTTKEIGPDSLLTSYQVGHILQVNPSSVNKWVKDGRIQAFRTPGGHHRIRAGDLVLFLHNHEMPVPRQLANADRRRVLVIDDDKKQLQAMERLFKPYARYVDVSLVDNGIDALVKLGSLRPHLALIDVIMPGLDGIEVCRRLKALPETLSIKLVVTSGQLTPEVEKRAREAGADLVLPKPVEVKRLVDMLDMPQDVALSA